jgi:hypothetical protein
MTPRDRLAQLRIQFTRLRFSDSEIAVSGGFLFSLIFSYPLLARLTFPGSNYDWDFSYEMAWTPYYTIRHFHQLPLWNPYKCGGLPMLANPQSRILTPMFFLQLLFGPVLGLHLEVILHLAIAWAGGYLLARTLGMSRFAALAAATLFPASSWFYLHLGEGHAVMLPFAYLPWLVLCLWRAFDQRTFTYAIVAGALLALMFGEGGVYAVTYSVLLTGVLAFAVAFLRGSPWPLLEVSFAGLFAAGFAAVKLFPSRAFVAQFPRLIGNGYSTDWRVLAISLFSPDQDKLRISPGGFGFHEYGAYVGVGFGLLALCAMLAPLRRTAPWLLAAFVMLLMSRGENSLFGFSLWSVLHRFPVFSSERLPSRWFIPLVFTLGVLAGYGADLLITSFGRAGFTRAAFLLLLGIIECWSVGPPNLRYALTRPELTPGPTNASFHQVWGFVNSLMFTMERMNDGAVHCYEYEDLPTHVIAVNQPGYRGEAYLLYGPQAGRLLLWSPDRLSYQVNATAPDRFVINQNYDPSWRLISGRGTVRPYQGLLSVELPAGSQRITLAYHDDAFLHGLLITLITALLAAFLIAFERRSSRQG